LPLHVAAPHLYESLAPRMRRASGERVDAYLQRRLGGAELEAVEDFLGTLASIGQAVLPVLLPAVGTVIGGPIGGAAGAAAGAAASAGIQAATADRKPAAAPPAHAAASKPKAGATPTARNGRAPSPPKPAAQPRPAAAPRSATQGAATQAAAAQLLTLLLSQELLQGLGQLLLGAAGAPTVEVDGELVPVPAMLGVVAELADRAAFEAAGSSAATAPVPAYLTDAESADDADITSDAARAEALWALFSAARAEDARRIESESNDWWSWNGGV
jgi:hypothetical protein